MQLLEDPQYVVYLPENVQVYYTDTDSGRYYYIQGYGYSYSLSYLIRRVRWGLALNNPSSPSPPVQKPDHSSQMWLGQTVPESSMGNVGDVYLNLSTSMLYGPKSLSGWGAGQLIGQSQSNMAGVLYTQSIPASTWVIEHNLGYDPVILRVMDSSQRQLSGEVIYSIPGVELTIIFDDAYAGQARLV